MKSKIAKYNSLFILCVIVFLAGILRMYNISINPPSLSWDEVSIGWNAYSIFKTGKDEHERVFPLDTFIAYGDYKPPLSIYLTVPSVFVFGLNEFSVRFPSALFGTLTVLLTYFLVKELFIRNKNQKLFSRDLPLLSAALLAISPWHNNLSRAGFEATIALFFVVGGVLLLLMAMRYPKIWPVAWLPFIGAIYTFNSSRYTVPLLGIGCVYIARKHIRQHVAAFCLGLGIALVCLMPIAGHLISKEARLRYTEVNIFTDPSVVVTANKRIEEAGNAWWAHIVFNRRVGYARSYLLHFFDHFQPEYLFVKGDGNPKFSIQDVGQLYMGEAPFLAIGIIAMCVGYPFAGLFLLYWIIVSIIPAAVARETPHALRTLNTLPTWQIFIAFGILTVWQAVSKIRTNIFRGILGIFFIGLYIYSVIYYLHTYYTHYPKEFSGEWQYGYKQALDYVKPIEKNYDTIYMTESIGRPYMYALFYKQTDPNIFFRTKDAAFDAAGFYHVYGFDKYKFIEKMPDYCNGSCLFIDRAGNEPEGANILQTIPLLNGVPILSIYET